MRIAIKLFFVAVVFYGCESINSMKYLKKDDYYQKSLANLKRDSIVYNTQIKAVVMAIYLNRVDKQLYEGDKESFFVGIYIKDDFKDKDKKALYNPLYSLKLNGANYTNIKNLDENDEILKKTPSTSRWYEYYIVEFEKDEADDVNLTFSNEVFGSASMSFLKESL